MGSTGCSPRPKSPPELYGKRREIGFLKEELKSIEKLQPASFCIKEVADYVGTNPEPLITLNKKTRKTCGFWKWLCGNSCFNMSWICCCCSGCSLKTAGCCGSCSTPECGSCSTPECCSCSMPECCSCSMPECCSCSLPKCGCTCKPRCPPCLKDCMCCCPKCDCSCYPKCSGCSSSCKCCFSCWPTKCSCPKLPKCSSCGCCSLNCFYSCCQCC